MDLFEPILADLRFDFTEGNLRAKVVASDSSDKVYIFVGRGFLDMFSPSDRVMVAGELFSPYWGEYLDDNLDRLPYWMAKVKYKMVDR